MRQKYYVELYYYKDGIKNLGFKEEPNLDDYKIETVMTEIVSESWEDAKRNLLMKYPNIAYIYVHETRNIDI